MKDKRNRKKAEGVSNAQTLTWRSGASPSSRFNLTLKIPGKTIYESESLGEYESALKGCSQNNYSWSPFLPGYDSFPILLKLTEKNKLFVTIPPTLYRVNKEYYFLNYSTVKGYIEATVASFESMRALKEFIDDNLLFLKYGDKKYVSSSIVLNERNPETKTCVRTVFDGSSELITELGGKSLATEIIIQPYLETKNRTDSIIRAFYEPPRFKLFSVIEGMRPEDTCATKMRDYGFTEVLEQCRHLFSMITKKYFAFSNMKVDGMIFDFIQHQSGISFFQNISGYHSRSSGIASVSSTKTSGFQTRKMSGHCVGFICKEKNLFVTKLIQAIKQRRRLWKV